MVKRVIDVFGIVVFATLFFLLGAFTAYSILKERLKLKAWEKAQREVWLLFTDMYEKERENLEKEIARQYEEKLRKWKQEFIENLKSKFPNLNLDELLEGSEQEE